MSRARGRFVHPVLLLVALTLLALLPFVGKAFHIDDPLFVWTAKQIQAEPLDPYGFPVNWYGTTMRMPDVTKNPPLASYVIAAVAAPFGFREVPLHLAFLIPALAVVLLTYRLGRRFTARPLLAAMIVLTTPVFLVSSTSVMCDVSMLALWLAAVWLWVSGLDRSSRGRLLAAAIATSLAVLFKYFALALVPLLAVYTQRRTVRLGAAWPLLIPVAVAAGYHVLTHELYGRGLLLDAFSYSTAWRFATASKTSMAGPAFTGGCVGVALLIAFVGLRWKSAVLWPLVAVAITIVGVYAGERAWPGVAESGRLNLGIHVGIFYAMGVGVIALVVADVSRRRGDADSFLLMLWVFGTYLFAGVFNWSTNGRSVLPMVPAVALLVARRFPPFHQRAIQTRDRVSVAILAVAGLLGWWVAWSDVQHANGARLAAQMIRGRTVNAPGRLLFEGHWGFQYYLHELGGAAFDRNTPLHPGDVLVLPENNTNVDTEPQPWMRLLDVVEVPAGAGVAVHRLERGAGFYADAFGPSPYVFGPVPPDRYRIYEIFDPSASPRHEGSAAP